MHTRSQDLAAWLRDQVSQAGARGLVVALTGTLNSAVVARLCQLAMPERVLGMIMPCGEPPASLADARLVAHHFQIPAVDVSLDGPAEQLVRLLAGALAAPGGQAGVHATGEQRERPEANLRARLRMTALYFAANSLTYLVAGAANRSELMIGSFTKHGDGGVDVLPLGALSRNEILAIARDLAVPESIIDKAKTVRLSTGPRDEAERGFTYDELERYLADGPEAVSPALALRIERLMRQSEHKRRGVPTPDTEARSTDA